MVAWSAVLAIGVSGVVAYASVSSAISERPLLRPFPGWVAVLQPSSGVGDHQVLLSVAPANPGAAGAQPRLRYSASVCGTSPWRGVLLLGGAARLTEVHSIPPIARGSTLSEIPDLRLRSANSGASIRLGPVQIVHMRYRTLPRCAAPYSRASPFPGFGGAVHVLSGSAGEPVQLASTGLLGWHAGTRVSQSWPLLGNLPGISPYEFGVFEGQAGLPGSWARPPRGYFSVEGASLSERTLVEMARPAPANTTDLSWTETQPVRATARLLDTDALAQWQDRLVFATIWLSLGGALMVAALFEAIRSALLPIAVSMREEEDDNRRDNPGRGASRTVGLRGVGALLLIAAAAWLGRRPRE